MRRASDAISASRPRAGPAPPQPAATVWQIRDFRRDTGWASPTCQPLRTGTPTNQQTPCGGCSCRMVASELHFPRRWSGHKFTPGPAPAAPRARPPRSSAGAPARAHACVGRARGNGSGHLLRMRTGSGGMNSCSMRMNSGGTLSTDMLADLTAQTRPLAGPRRRPGRTTFGRSLAPKWPGLPRSWIGGSGQAGGPCSDPGRSQGPPRPCRVPLGQSYMVP